MLEGLVQSESFAVAVGLAARVQRAMQDQASRSTRRVLHALNLPAGTDVTRILNELGQLKRQVRDLSAQLDEAQAELRAGASGPAAAQAGGRETLTWPSPSTPASSRRGSGGTPSATCCASATVSSTSPGWAGRS